MIMIRVMQSHVPGNKMISCRSQEGIPPTTPSIFSITQLVRCIMESFPLLLKHQVELCQRRNRRMCGSRVGLGWHSESHVPTIPELQEKNVTPDQSCYESLELFVLDQSIWSYNYKTFTWIFQKQSFRRPEWYSGTSLWFPSPHASACLICNCGC